MGKPNVNIAVRGFNYLSVGYKTVTLKRDVPLGEQMVEPNAKYIVRYPFEIGTNPIVHPLVVTDGGEMPIGGKTYYWLFLVSPRDNYRIELVDSTLVFVTRNPDAILPTREVTLNKGELIHIASTVVGIHPKAFATDEDAIQIPDNSIVAFEGGSFNHGSVYINNAQVTPAYENLLNSTIVEIYGVPAAGTFYYQKEKPTWSNSVRWVDAYGFSPALSKGTTAERPVPQHEVETEEGVTIVGDLLPEDVGFQYFDTDLGKPIWWNGESWVDANGENPDASDSEELNEETTEE